MRSIIGLMLYAMLVTEAQASDSLQVDVQPLGEDGYQLVAKFPQPIAVADAQQALLPVATELCGIRAVHLGRYKFESTGLLIGQGAPTSAKGGMRFEQAVHCGDSVASTAGTADLKMAPLDPPTPDDEETIRRLTLAYLTAKDAGEFDTAHAMLSASTAGMFTVASWRLPRAAFSMAAGSTAQPTVQRITWYDNPASAPGPGRYVAADYSASYANAAFYCGYVMWLLQPDGSYRIEREEEGRMSNESAGKIAAGDMAAVRKQLGCRD